MKNNRLKNFLGPAFLIISLSTAQAVDMKNMEILKDFGEVKNGTCQGQAVPIGYRVLHYDFVESSATLKDAVSKMDLSYMSMLGMEYISKKTLNNYTVLTYKSSGYKNRYYTFSIKNIKTGTLICSVVYQ
ncbi:hypothetical protein GCM10017783_21540 [Deinococcus piscis]|uniref:Uncharacterized protein n=1 Tax=Deinococcus piscis TaxID=394230 RepID=A0ABQ3K9D3_9DEIO|nr:hypothetical protein [Deinococcus piscis]GHG08665.1 hypothetical protein GCM10017783_21540 [Deinococcus piscis]